MQVHYDEGVAIHIGPEPCVGVREGVVEALAGERIGQPLSRERVFSRMPTLSTERKVMRLGALVASVLSIRRGRRPWHVRTLLAREPGGLASGRQWSATVSVCIGKARSHSR